VNPKVSRFIPSLSKYTILTLLVVIFSLHSDEKVLPSQSNIEMVLLVDLAFMVQLTVMVLQLAIICSFLFNRLQGFFSVRMTRQLVILVCCAALSLVTARKFCPKERNGDECRAKQNQYKCGVFFKDLTSKVPLAWLGALPEAVVRARKEGASDNDVISLLGSNVDAESYEGDVCGDTLANTRCYAQVVLLNILLC